MKMLAAPLLAVLLTAGIASAQITPRVYNHPLVPSAEALNRLGMKLSWKAFLPVEDSRDGIATAQVWGDRLFVQLRNGAVLAIHADTGQTLWRARVGPPYRPLQPLGFNYDTVFGVNGTLLFALDRASGRTKWAMELPNVPTTAPVADSQRVYVCLTSNRIHVYRLPVPGVDPDPPPLEKKLPAMPPPGQKPKPESAPTPPDIGGARRSALGTFYASESRAVTPLTERSRPPNITYTPLASATQAALSLAQNYQLPLAWEYRADSRLELAPLVTLRKPDSVGAVLLPSTAGITYGSSKIARQLLYSFQTEAPVSAPPGQYGDIAYIPYGNDILVAMNIENGRLLWRLAIGGTSRRKPQVTDEDVWMMPERAGLYRVSRASGEVIWDNSKVEQFLAANKEMVYTLDARGHLLVLDRKRGTPLGSYDISDFKVPIVNDYTDRVFLASHDGLLICLHDRHYAAPSWNKQLLEEPKPQPRQRAEAMADKDK
jgi:outer membrane protein assembly factor BamB